MKSETTHRKARGLGRLPHIVWIVLFLLCGDGDVGRGAQLERHLRLEYNYEVLWRTAHPGVLEDLRRAGLTPTLAAVLERRIAARLAKTANEPKPVEERLVLVFPSDNLPRYPSDNVFLRRQGQGVVQDLQTLPPDGKSRVEIARIGQELLSLIEEDRRFYKGNLTEALSLLLETVFEALHQIRLDAAEKVLIREKVHDFVRDEGVLGKHSVTTLTDFYDRCIVVAGLIRQSDFIGRTGREDMANIARKMAETTRDFLSPPKSIGKPSPSGVKPDGKREPIREVRPKTNP